MANGANREDICRQVLIEALSLCFLGSLVGVVAGAGAAAVIEWLSVW